MVNRKGSKTGSVLLATSISEDLKNIIAAHSLPEIIQSPAKKMMRIPPDPEDMNDRRAEAAGEALDQFIHGDLGEYVDEDVDLTVQNLTDLIADFGHFCDRNNIQFAEILRMAAYHYEEETNSKGKQEFCAS